MPESMALSDDDEDGDWLTPTEKEDKSDASTTHLLRSGKIIS